MPLVEGQVYRRTVLHAEFGGQRQGGISTPTGQGAILAFTGASGVQHGYADGWVEGVFCYYGEGQAGDMQWVRGNRALRDQPATGRPLFLFENLARPRSHVAFIGVFEVASWEYRTAPDRKGNQRRAIVFHLVRAQGEDVSTDVALPGVALDQLREAALVAGTDAPERSTRTARRSYIERAEAVRAYAIARADGVCECCRQPAPFRGANGAPFLEVHHICRLSDGGPDRINAVAAVCPNCHRKVHHAVDKADINRDLLERIEQIERDLAH